MSKNRTNVQTYLKENKIGLMPLNEQTNIHKNIEKTLYHLRMYSIKVYRNIGMQGVQELFFCYPKGPGGSSNKFHFKCCNLFLIMES